jgi:Na+-transporting methylmalonyl-CoA/oxaloacetate decarboxylase gamma subunit
MIKHFFGLSEDKQAVALLFANGSGRTLQSIMEGVTPVLANLFLLAQIVVAIGTAIWFFRRSRGVQLDNEAKEKKRKRKLKMKNLLLLMLLGGLLTGCAGFPLKGGQAYIDRAYREQNRRGAKRPVPRNGCKAVGAQRCRLGRYTSVCFRGRKCCVSSAQVNRRKLDH